MIVKNSIEMLEIRSLLQYHCKKGVLITQTTLIIIFEHLINIIILKTDKTFIISKTSK